MYTYFLAAHERIDHLLSRLKVLVSRPAFLASAAFHQGHDAVYREPAELGYRPRGSLDIFLARWSDNGLCVGRENERRKFDLRPAPFVHLVYPLGNGDNFDRFSNENFQHLGIQPALNGAIRTVFISTADNVTKDLEPFVCEYRSIRYKGPGICFAVSELIEAPHELRAEWHRGLLFSNGQGGVAESLQAPGWYSGDPKRSLDKINRMCLVDAVPGACIVCHGTSRERRHLAMMQTANRAFPAGHICRACLPEAAAQWQRLLDSWEPPPVPEPEKP